VLSLPFQLVFPGKMTRFLKNFCNSDVNATLGIAVIGFVNIAQRGHSQRGRCKQGIPKGEVSLYH